MKIQPHPDYLELHCPPNNSHPYQKLWAAVLHQALDDLRNARLGPKLRTSAWTFIQSDFCRVTCELAGQPELLPVLRKVKPPDLSKPPPPPQKRCIAHDGTIHTVKELAETTGIPAQTIYQRLWRGWSIPDVLSEYRRRQPR